MGGVANAQNAMATLDGALLRLPHADPFRFVTQVSTLEPGVAAQGVWRVRGDEDFFRGHFPGHPIVPGVLIGEALAQLSGLVCGRLERSNQGRLAQVDLRFVRAVVPPADMELKAELLRSLEGLHLFAVEASERGQMVARGRLTLALESEASA